ncbi:MAG TPA: hypothetical protein VGL72_15620 [Bryobacteraceae bacterium]|jgi:hypothetical protein
MKWQTGMMRLVGFLAVAAIGGMAMDNKKIDQIPTEVRDYLTAGDGLAQFAVHEKYPHVEQTLNSAATRTAILEYLGSKEPWQDPPTLTINAIAFLQTKATAKEAEIIRPLVGHANPWVRLKVHEYMMAVYYPAHDRAAMISLFEEMLGDRDELVRVQAARWIKALNFSGEMHDYLQQWTMRAEQRKWNQQESFGMIKEMLR